MLKSLTPLAALGCALAGLLIDPGSAAAQQSAAGPPAWAYPVNPPNMPASVASTAPVHVPHSRLTFLAPQLIDRFSAPDWFPGDHPPMPPVIAHGRTPDVFACAYCHLPDGAGRPENASLAGLPPDYIKEQLADMRSGARRTAVPERSPPQLMFTLSRSMTDEEISTAAQYFSQLPAHNRTRIIEGTTAPHTHVAGWFLAADAHQPPEPIGHRIIEVPEDLERFEHRDERIRILAYVPPGSIRAGELLVGTGGENKTLACSGCHGAKLTGTGNIPAIAGRSPSYIVRQLFDIQSGVRGGSDVAPMQDVVRKLTIDDMIAIASYLATRH